MGKYHFARRAALKQTLVDFRVMMCDELPPDDDDGVRADA